MKKQFFNLYAVPFLVLLALCSAFSSKAQSGEGLGLPGDNLNLSAVLDVFQQSKTLEEFETSVNSDNNKINNLDLNYDGKIDYIKVRDYADGSTHSVVMQVDINQNESQDLAVIYIDKNSSGEIDIQIVGDEALYGKNYVVDLGQNNHNGTPNPGYNGGAGMNDYDIDYRAPSSWNIIVYMYTPAYNPWSSPWYWGYYPRRWSAWSPIFWNDYNYHCYHNYPWGYHNYYYSNRNRFSRHHNNWYVKK